MEKMLEVVWRAVFARPLWAFWLSRTGLCFQRLTMINLICLDSFDLSVSALTTVLEFSWFFMKPNTAIEELWASPIGLCRVIRCEVFVLDASDVLEGGAMREVPGLRRVGPLHSHLLDAQSNAGHPLKFGRLNVAILSILKILLNIMKRG